MANYLVRIAGNLAVSPVLRYYYYDTTDRAADGGSPKYIDTYNISKFQFYNRYAGFNIPENDMFWDASYYPIITTRTTTPFHEYCSGTTKKIVYFDGSLIQENEELNSLTCGYDPQDIRIISIIQTPSGSNVIVEINAVSSNGGLTYSLDGRLLTYQASNQFTITSSGIYVAWVKDAKGNIARESFEVRFATYGLRYLGEFINDVGETFDIKILKSEYSGSYDTLKLTGTPLKIQYNQERDEKYKVIKGSEATVSFYSETDFQFVELFTAEDKNYKLEVYKNQIKNYNFSNGLTNWFQGVGDQWAAVNNKASCTFSTQSAILSHSCPTNIGVSYTFSFEITNSHSSASYSIYLYNSTPGDGIVYSGVAYNESVSITRTPTGSYKWIGIQIQGSAQTVTLDNVTVKHLFWTGFIAPEAYSEPYLAPPYPVSCTFLDGLGLLKRRDFVTPTNGLLNSIKSQIEIVKTCLLFTGLDLPILTAIDVLEAGMSFIQTEHDAIWQAYIDTGAFLDDDSNPMNCYDVLEYTLANYGVRVFQEDGQWKIISIDDMADGYTGRVYNSQGVFQYYGSVNPAVTLTTSTASTKLCFVEGSQRLEITPGFKEVEAEIKIKKVKSVISNGNFETEGEGVVFKDWDDDFGILERTVSKDERGDLSYSARITGDGDDNGWVQYIKAKSVTLPVISNGLKLVFKTRFKVTTASTTLTDVKAKFKVKLDASWLSSTGTWETTETFITPKATINTTQEITIESNVIPSSGVLELEIYQAQVFDVGQDAQHIDVEYVDISFAENNVKIPETKTFKVLNSGSYVYVPPVKKLMFGDFVEYSSSGVLLKNSIYLDQEGAEQTSANWYRRNLFSTERYNINELLIERIIKNNVSPSQIVLGSIYGNLRFSNVVTDTNNSSRKFMVNSMTMDLRSSISRVELVELTTATDLNKYLLAEDKSRLTIESERFYLLLEG